MHDPSFLFHSYSHPTFANRVYHQLNHDLVKTQQAMGHKNINSTVAYLSFVEDEIDQAILAI